MYRIILNVILLNIMPLMCLEFTGIQSISALTIMALIRISLDWSIIVNKIPLNPKKLCFDVLLCFRSQGDFDHQGCFVYYIESKFFLFIFGKDMHFWLVLACHSYCLAYFPYAYRVLYFLFVIIHIYVLLSVCVLVYSMTPCRFVCGFSVQYSIGVEYSIDVQWHEG
jgi:hypothetical protein